MLREVCHFQIKCVASRITKYYTSSSWSSAVSSGFGGFGGFVGFGVSMVSVAAVMWCWLWWFLWLRVLGHEACTNSCIIISTVNNDIIVSQISYTRYPVAFIPRRKSGCNSNN